jgi:hypothetical protein
MRTKKSILMMPLESFGIKPLTNWVKRGQRRLSESEKPDGIPLQPQTVAELIHKYPYRFPPMKMKWGYHNVRNIGLGMESITELKQKILALGLTPDDWPALVRHDEFLTYLSKATIMKLPVMEVIIGRYLRLQVYMNCTEEEFHTKSFKDFLRIDPLATESFRYGNDICSIKRQLVAIRQKLVAKGFTTRDGAFFKWNPEQSSLAKALEKVQKYDLPHESYMQFARIAVAERWVI